MLSIKFSRICHDDRYKVVQVNYYSTVHGRTFLLQTCWNHISSDYNALCDFNELSMYKTRTMTGNIETNRVRQSYHSSSSWNTCMHACMAGPTTQWQLILCVLFRSQIAFIGIYISKSVIGLASVQTKRVLLLPF